MLLAIALMGCVGSQKDSSEEHAHQENLQLTSYGNDFEIYAEAAPFVIGQASEIFTHITDLSNSKPLEEGIVTLSLIVGADGIHQTLNSPTKTGIYSFALTPKTTGVGKLIFDIKSIKGNSQVIVPNIRVYADIHDTQHAAADAAVSSSNGVVFSKEQGWKVDFATEQSKQKPFGQVIKTTAQIIPSQGDQHIVTAKASGIISFSTQNLFVRASTLEKSLTNYRDSFDNHNNIQLLKKALDGGEISLLNYLLEVQYYYQTIKNSLLSERDLELTVARLSAMEL